MKRYNHIKEIRRQYYMNNRNRMLEYSKRYYEMKKKIYMHRSTLVKVITYSNCNNKQLLIISFD
jgi:hypothetical protein